MCFLPFIENHHGMCRFDIINHISICMNTVLDGYEMFALHIITSTGYYGHDKCCKNISHHTDSRSQSLECYELCSGSTIKSGPHDYSSVAISEEDTARELHTNRRI